MDFLERPSARRTVLAGTDGAKEDACGGMSCGAGFLPAWDGTHSLQEEVMRLVSRVAAVLAAVAFAVPAFACGDKAEKTSTKSAEAKPAAAQPVAKSGEKKSASPAKRGAEAKPATAAN